MNSRITLKGKGERILRDYDDYELMRESYPLKIYLQHKKYIVVPIQPDYSRRLFGGRPSDSELTQLKLRVDHAYYCTPKHTDLRPGDFVLFYETKLGGNAGGAFGIALVRGCKVNTPDILWQEYKTRGVFGLSDIKQHTNSAGKSMVIHFDFFEPFSKAVSLDRIRLLLKRNTVFQTLTSLTREEFRNIIIEGYKNK